MLSEEVRKLFSKEQYIFSHKRKGVNVYSRKIKGIAGS